MVLTRMARVGPLVLLYHRCCRYYHRNLTSLMAKRFFSLPVRASCDPGFVIRTRQVLYMYDEDGWQIRTGTATLAFHYSSTSISVIMKTDKYYTLHIIKDNDNMNLFVLDDKIERSIWKQEGMYDFINPKHWNHPGLMLANLSDNSHKICNWMIKKINCPTDVEGLN